MTFKFEDNSEAVKAEIERQMTAGLTAGAEIILNEAKATAPRDKGGLVRSMTKKISPNGSASKAKIGATVDYAAYVEYGTGEFASNGSGRKGGWFYQSPDGKFYFSYGEKPTHFLRDSFKANENDVQSVIEKHMGGLS